MDRATTPAAAVDHLQRHFHRIAAAFVNCSNLLEELNAAAAEVLKSLFAPLPLLTIPVEKKHQEQNNVMKSKLVRKMPMIDET